MRETEKRLTVRLLWPFARGGWTDPLTAEAYARVGIGPAEFVHPDTRVPHRLAMEVLASYVARTGDVTVGLRAGGAVELGDFDALALVHAARTCATRREAVRCFGRYAVLLNEAAEISFVEGAHDALWRFRTTDGVPQPPAANDFVLACSVTVTRLYAGQAQPVEVHVAHPRPSDRAHFAQYDEMFPGSTLRFGMPQNGFVIRGAWLDEPMPLRAAPQVQAAFEMRARELTDRLVSPTLRHRVTEVVTAHLRTGRTSMKGVAHSCNASVATLRRRLEEEGTTFSQIFEASRRCLAETYLLDPRLNISEVAYRLGFAHAPAFNAAFRKWNGITPSEYRAHVLGGPFRLGDRHTSATRVRLRSSANRQAAIQST